MQDVVFKIGNGKVVHYGTKYNNGVVSSSCNNLYAEERNKDLKPYSSLDEITCKSCYSHKEWYVRMEEIKKELEEKAKTFKLKEIEEVEVGEIYKEKATHFHFSGKYALNKAKVLGIESSQINGCFVKKVIVALLDKNLKPVLQENTKEEIVNIYELDYFKDRFSEIIGNKYNA